MAYFMTLLVPQIMALNRNIVDERETGRDVQGSSHGQTEYPHDIPWLTKGRLEKSKEMRCPSRESNQTPPANNREGLSLNLA
jgi:hypothetical protein